MSTADILTLRRASKTLHRLADEMTQARASGNDQRIASARRGLLDHGYLSDAVAEKVATAIDAEVRKSHIQKAPPDAGLVALSERINQPTTPQNEGDPR